ncbi:MAG: hypothetical protein IPL61_29460 [Myxococcales bacterium]|nr:hypothetical protein [Myxococcales bacterium]
MLELDLESGHLSTIAESVFEPTPIAAHRGNWTYLKKVHGNVAIVFGNDAIPWHGPLPVSAIISRGESLYILAGEILFLIDGDGSVPRAIAKGIRSIVSSTAGSLWVCTANDRLAVVNSGKISTMGKCRSSGARFDIAAAGEFVAAISPTGESLRIEQGRIDEMETGEVNSIAVSDKGIIAGVGADDSTWFILAGSAQKLRGPSTTSVPSALAAAGSLVAWGFRDGRGQVWDALDKKRWQLTNGADPIFWIFLHGDIVVTVSAMQARVWHLRSNTPAVAAELACFPLALSPAERMPLVAYQCGSGAVGVVDIESHRHTQLHTHRDISFGMAWAGNMLCTGGYDGDVVCSDVKGESAPTRTHVSSPVTVLRSGTTNLYIGEESGSVWQWSANGGPLTLIAEFASRPEFIGEAVDGALFIVSKDGTVYRGEPRNGDLVQASFNVGSSIVGATIADRAMVVATRDGRVLQVEPTSGVATEIAVAQSGLSSTSFFDNGHGWVAAEGGHTLWVHRASLNSRTDFNALIRRISRPSDQGTVLVVADGGVIEQTLDGDVIRAIDIGTGRPPLVVYAWQGVGVIAAEGYLYVLDRNHQTSKGN